MKKLAVFLLALVMLLGLLPAAAVAAEDEYVYPMSSVEKLPGTIRNSDNKYVIVNGYYGAIIDLQGLDYDTVTITRNASNNTMGYAFLRERPTVNEVPDYAGSFYAVVWDQRPSAVLSIPEDAAYLYIYYNSNATMFLPASVVFKNAGDADDGGDTGTPEETEPVEDELILDATSIKVATWNIGHFSIGKNTNTKLGDATFRESYNSYCDYLYGRINADLITVNEYSAMFTPSYRAKDTIFNRYPTQFEGTQYRYSCNALFSRLPVDGLRMQRYACNQTAKIEHTNLIAATDYYYLQGQITLGGESVTVVTAHLAFDNTKNPDTVCLDQIDELIRKLSDYERVLLMGDWNTREFSYFNRFAEAGYTLGNTNPSRVTCAGLALDNIIVKGLEISDYTVHTTALSDHYAVSATITLGDAAPTHSHNYDAVVTAPTCTKEGYTTHTCAECGNSYKTDMVEAKGHTQKTVGAVAPTCTNTGLTEGIQCSTCGEFLQAQSEIAALGHSYGDWETVADGQKARTCAVCGAVHREGEAEPTAPAQTEATTDAPQTDDDQLQTQPTEQLTQDAADEEPPTSPLVLYIAVAVAVVAAVATVVFVLLRKKKTVK